MATKPHQRVFPNPPIVTERLAFNIPYSDTCNIPAILRIIIGENLPIDEAATGHGVGETISNTEVQEGKI